MSKQLHLYRLCKYLLEFLLQCPPALAESGILRFCTKCLLFALNFMSSELLCFLPFFSYPSTALKFDYSAVLFFL